MRSSGPITEGKRMKEAEPYRTQDRRPRTAAGELFISCRLCGMKEEDCRGECLQAVAEKEIRRVNDGNRI